MVSHSQGHVVRRSTTIAFIIAAVGCQQPILAPGRPPDPPWPQPPAAAPGVPLDVNCTTGGSAGDGYERNCSRWDVQGERHAQQADELFGRFAWELFRWLNPQNGQVQWKDWTSLKTTVRSRCQSVEELSQFTTRADSTDCTRAMTKPVSNPIWDIHGNPVEFETRIDPKTWRQLCGSKMYPGPKLEEIACQHIKSTEWSQLGSGLGLGPMHIKIAWKTVTDQDCKLGRQFILKGTMQFGCEAGEAGMVAMHIAIKGRSGGHEWTWATFSHRDNLASENPMFQTCEENEPGCNACPESGGPTHIRRVNPIPRWIDKLNQANKGQPYASYLLLGIQRQANAWAVVGHRGEPRPSSMANEIIEWDRQQSDCIGCHSKATVKSFRGTDKQARNHCLANDQCKDTTMCGRFIRCDPEPDTPGGIDLHPVFEADFFWGIEDWYANFDDHCKEV